MTNYPVFPLNADKSPRGPWRGTSQPEERWAQTPPLWGIETGPTSGIFVLDIDTTYKGIDLPPELHSLPPTFTVRTRRGGRHLYLRYEDGISNAGGWPGVDVRGDGGYVVRYDDVIDASPVASAPGWLVERLRAAAARSGAHDGSQAPQIDLEHREALFNALPPEVASIFHSAPVPGKRSDRIWRAIHDLLAHDWSAEDVYTVMTVSPDYLDKATTTPGSLWRQVLKAATTDVPAPKADSATTAADDGYAAEVAQAARRLRIERDARSLVAGEDYTGSRVLTLADLKAVSVDWLVKDFIGAGTTNCVVGKSNLGKTFTVVDLVCNTILERPWLGKATRRVPVVYVLAEGVMGFYSRIEAWCDANGANVSDLEPWLYFVDGANLSNAESLRRIQELITEKGAGLVVIDTFAAAAGVESENDNGLVSLVLNNTRDAVGDAALLFTHHPTKQTEDSPAPVLRGAGAIAGLLDTVMTLHRDSGFIGTHDDAGYFTLSTDARHAGKSRNSRTETFTGLYLGMVGESAALMRDVTQQLTGAERAVLAALGASADGHLTVTQYAESAGLSREQAQRHLTAALGSGFLTRETAGKGFRYYLAPHALGLAA